MSKSTVKIPDVTTLLCAWLQCDTPPFICRLPSLLTDGSYQTYGNTVVKIVFSEFFLPLPSSLHSAGIYDLMIIMREMPRSHGAGGGGGDVSRRALFELSELTLATCD